MMTIRKVLRYCNNKIILKTKQENERIHINSKPNGDRVCVYVRLIEKGRKREREIDRKK